jgi:hypothetical protein
MVYITLRITGFLEFAHRSAFKKLEKTFRKLDLFPSSGEGETLILLGPLEKANLNLSLSHIESVSLSVLVSSPGPDTDSSLKVAVLSYMGHPL